MHAQASIDVINARVHQLEEEEWDYEHDDQYVNKELAYAAMCYIVNTPDDWWPFGDDDWKPKTYRENLVRAAALLIAEIERIDRINE